MLKKGKIFPWQSFDHQKSPISLQKVAIGEWPLQPDNRHEMGEQPKENHSPSITIPRRYDYSHPQIDGIGNPNKTLKMMYFSIYLGRNIMFPEWFSHSNLHIYSGCPIQNHHLSSLISIKSAKNHPWSQNDWSWWFQPTPLKNDGLHRQLGWWL